MKTIFIRQIVIAFAVIVPVYLSVFAQNSNSTVDSVNNPPLPAYDLLKLDSGAISWNSEEGYWYAVNNDAATTEDGVIIPLPVCRSATGLQSLLLPAHY
ncbi:MAG: hypothetical protein IJG38_00190 [Thermoguttaceae bacterium]|nr:hypothetical protein [Thermoguttaceae bacterium]